MQAVSRYLPDLARTVPWVPLGNWPTPVTSVVVDGRALWIKNEGASSPLYGGNKVRTLEAWLGDVRDRGARKIWAIGAFGSNHAIATVSHARAAGLDAGAIVFPQPPSSWAIENYSGLLASGCPMVHLRSVVEVPFAAAWVARREPSAIVMPPGGATTVGTFGAMAAAFELAEQIAAGVVPAPRRIVLAIGSTCTTAGLLAGLALARATGAWRWPMPIVHGVRVTPWPVTSRLRIAWLARQTLVRAGRLGGTHIPVSVAELHARLTVDGDELGPGYGRPTEAATRATMVLGPLLQGPSAPRLDGVYTAKAAAALLRLHRAGVGPLLFWASKSTTVVPQSTLAVVRTAPGALRRWLRQGG